MFSVRSKEIILEAQSTSAITLVPVNAGAISESQKIISPMAPMHGGVQSSSSPGHVVSSAHVLDGYALAVQVMVSVSSTTQGGCWGMSSVKMMIYVLNTGVVATEQAHQKRYGIVKGSDAICRDGYVQDCG